MPMLYMYIVASYLITFAMTIKAIRSNKLAASSSEGVKTLALASIAPISLPVMMIWTSARAIYHARQDSSSEANTRISDQEMLALLPAMKAVASYQDNPSTEQLDLIERARREGLVVSRGEYLVSWTTDGIERFRQLPEKTLAST